MAITDSFRKAVSMGDVRQIRIMMKDSLLADPTFAEYNEMSNLARSVTGLYDDHDGGREFKSTGWNDDYMDMLKVKVVGNFSHERLNHLKEVVMVLRPVTAPPPKPPTISVDRKPSAGSQSGQTQPPKSGSEYERQKHRDQQNGSYRGAKIVGGAVVGAVIGGTIAAVASSTVAAGAVVGAVVVGAGVAIATNGEK